VKRAFLIAAVLIAAPALAKKDPEFVRSDSVDDKPVVALDPAQGHVLLRSPNQRALYLMKVPSADDQVAYDALKAEAYADARKKYEKKLASYQAAVKQRAAGTAQVSVPDEPVEPTEAGFEFTPFGLLASVAIGPLYRFAKGDGGASTYLHAVTPGRYRIYGPITAAGNGAMLGTCYCLGSVSFEVKAGEVTDISALAMIAPEETPDGVPQVAGKVKDGAVLPPVDPRLANATVTTARFSPVGKAPNYFGLAITRMPAIPGVMRYDRDRVVDLTGGAGAVVASASGQ
jgi:hypothetical protein